MAIRPLIFGLRLRDKGKGRTVRVRSKSGRASSYVVEDSRDGSGTRTRQHASLGAAIADAASTWRHRLH